MIEISYKDMINSLIREIDAYESSIRSHMNTMLSAQSPDIVDANYASINHTLISLWRTRKALLKAIEEQEAKKKAKTLNNLYGKSCYIDTDSAEEVPDEKNIT